MPVEEIRLISPFLEMHQVGVPVGRRLVAGLGRPFCKARSVKTVARRDVIPSGRRVLPGNRHVVEIWPGRKREERVRDVINGEVFRDLAKGNAFGYVAGSTRGTYQ